MADLITKFYGIDVIFDVKLTKTENEMANLIEMKRTRVKKRMTKETWFEREQKKDRRE